MDKRSRGRGGGKIQKLLWNDKDKSLEIRLLKDAQQDGKKSVIYKNVEALKSAFPQKGDNEAAASLERALSLNASCGPWQAQCPDGFRCDGLSCLSKQRLIGSFEVVGSHQEDKFRVCKKNCIGLKVSYSGLPVFEDRSVYIPEGDFWMGSNEFLDKNAWSDQSPEHQVFLSAYAIDLTPVTAYSYRNCVKAGVCQAPKTAYPDDYSTYHHEEEMGDHPINKVTWEMASTYCKWQDKRLPTEAEWERAARGGCETVGQNCKANMRVFPWDGNSEGPHLLNDRRAIPSTTPVKSYPAGRSPYGLYDMAGNVWEWLSDWYDEDAYQKSAKKNPRGPDTGTRRVLRGGLFISDYTDLHLSNRFSLEPQDASYKTGFRCARSL